MLEFLNSLLPGFALGRNVLAAAEALEQPPHTPRLQRLRSFAVAAGLLGCDRLTARETVERFRTAVELTGTRVDHQVLPESWQSRLKKSS